MNPYLEPPGFLGTGASLLADFTLVAYLLLIIPLMILGFIFARRNLHRPHHKWAMTLVTAVNWVLIIFLMFAAYRFDVAPNFSQQPDNTRYLLPVVHGILGIPAQLLATFVVIRMFLEDRNVARAKARGEKDTSRYWFRSAKPVMRLTLILWLLTASLGVISYLTRYEIIPAFALSGNVPPPIATDDVIAPETTLEVNETSEAPVATPEATAELDMLLTTPDADVPIETQEAMQTSEPPVETPEVDDDVTPPAETPEVSEPAGTPEVREPVETPEVEDEDEGDDGDFRVEGRLEAVGSIAVIVDGQRYDISNARVDDPLRVGMNVRMEVSEVNGQFVVDRIRAEDDDD
jgi:uncharacterized membrane protein YozB (DUF420 family)